jgi:hypothetical protein
MKKPPLALVKEKYQGKQKLVDLVAGQLAPMEGESKDDLRTRLSGASNRKLLKLLDAQERVREIFGSKEKLVDELLKHTRPGSKKTDADFRAMLLKKSNAALLAMHTARARKAPASKSK